MTQITQKPSLQANPLDVPTAIAQRRSIKRTDWETHIRVDKALNRFGLADLHIVHSRPG